ncbi:MAG: hypothetical protein NTX44_01600 [Ignavibacteriales bacterium]|nr:hypothetical protein [Ignavibacteriales bacterium]
MKIKSEYTGTILSVGYVHLNPFTATESQLKELSSIRERVIPVISDIYKMKVQIISDYEEGSLKSWLWIAGTLYIGIGNYGEFRSGVEYLAKDAKMVAEKLNELVIHDFKPNESQIFRVERRTAVPGILKVVIHKVDSLAANINDMSPHQVKEQLLDIDHTLQRAVDLSSVNEDQTYMIKETINLLDEHFPVQPTSQQQNKIPVYAWRKELELLVQETQSSESRRVISRIYLH